MSVTSVLPIFVGREEELHVLAAAWADAQAGEPRFALVQGEPGIGKTSLIEQLLLDAADDARVLRASGAEPEAELRFGVCDQLLRTAGVPDPEILAAAATHELDVGARTLEVLGEQLKAGPVLIMVDDAQWADEASLTALAFVAHRLVRDRVMVVLGTRGEVAPDALQRFFDRPHGLRLRLGALGPPELRALAAGVGVSLSQRFARQLWSHTRGSPLHARALLEELPPVWWTRVDVELPAPSSYAAATAQRLEQCSAAAQRLVEAVTVLGVPCSLADASAVGGVEDGFEAADEAVSAGLLWADDPLALGFPHPLVAAAVARGLSPARRARLHRRAADNAVDEGAMLRHRAAAAPGRDPALADELDVYAMHAHARHAREQAINALVSASRLSAYPSDRDDRLLRAVDWTLDGGDLVRARALAEELASTVTGTRHDVVLANLAIAAGDVDTAAPLLAAAWGSVDAGADPALAALIAHRSAMLALTELRDADVVTWCRRARELGPAGDVGVDSTAMLALALRRLGRRQDAETTLEAAWTGRDDADAPLRATRGWLRWADDDLRGARADLAAAAETELRLGALGAAAIHLSTLARVCYAAGAWDDAVATAERALTISSELGGARVRAFAWWAATVVPAARGDDVAVAEYAAGTEAEAESIEATDGAVAVAMALALPAAARADAGGVLAALEPVRDVAECANVDAPGFWPWQDIYAEALVGAGRLSAAAAFLGVQEGAAAERGSASMVARLARVRGQFEAALQKPDAAMAAFERALETIVSVEMPYEEALIRLALGQFLRRRGHRRTAAKQLDLARTTLVALDARPALERCDRELVACGLNRLPREPTSSAALLTPQEQAVARMAAAGKTNRQVAAGLQLSIKTVEVHLTHIFMKLGIKSRMQLMAHAAAFEGDA